jgi:flagellin
MGSAVSLSAAMQANLYSLDTINSQIQTAQTDLSTGKSVNSASDNATAYFEAQSANNESSQLNNLKDAMGQGLQVVQTALTTISSATSLLQQMQALAQQAESTTDTTQITNLQTQFNQLQGQLSELTQNDANYQGTNLLAGSVAGNNLTINFNADGTSTITIAATDTTTATYQPVAATNWTGGAANIQASQTAASDAVTAYNGLSQTLGSYSALITTRQYFTTQLSQIFSTGANNLTNADLNQESADLLALQTQQSLSVSALSIANQSNQSILRLFQ